ncbi:enoyl-CoA hydratase/isomerase family protein [Hornefia butyriciproducens]|uniref:Enoyl-CoA hydratase/isomerase family protein n=1 Tax=Hornefia butyriciproducens TaxID=2652293 RepID=A0A6L5Y3V5_9FIRM|nr:enoyl-CoA hydratase/isomerase family protein [Hornefia butyriciproducens]MCI7678959.1 enoyl-CoA hydratase/isomerase family protein [Clostridiales bacterium]MDY5463651.1 enoyl-CoA hydratase/isomerase family protein [Hornefia butyriciproducens]MST51303.1 enoyl-CoA hydratase/isomerase family protein [Hornefia butyriciproducens]
MKTLLDKRDGIGIITMNCPDNLNAIDVEMSAELLERLQSCDQDDEIKVVVLRSGAKAFSAGGDLVYSYKKLQAGDDIDFTELVENVGKLVLEIKTMRKLVITQVDGVAAGAGASLAISGDIVLLSDRATLVQAFVNVGLVPDTGGTYLLTHSLGMAQAMKFMITGEPMKSADALAFGLATEVVESKELEAVTEKWANKIAKGPLKAYENLKRQVYYAAYRELPMYLENGEKPTQLKVSHSSDFREGVAAFVEKRKPQFQGK